VAVLGVMFVAWSFLMLLAGWVPVLLVGVGGCVLLSFFRLLVGWMEATDHVAYP
jgi:hypothetical protein